MWIHLVDVRGDWEYRNDIRIKWWVTKQTIEEIQNPNIDSQVAKTNIEANEYTD